jgi:RHS repeat-associated protein
MRAFRIQTQKAEPSIDAQYFYDAGGQRVKKVVRKQGNQVEVTTYVEGLFEQHRTFRGDGKKKEMRENSTLHVMDGANRVAVVRIGAPFPGDASPAVQYHLGDHLGGSNVVIDDKGQWINREEYTPYGETSYGSFALKRYRYTGKERDEESGLYYHGARYYAPWLARWISADPAGMTDGPSLYGYALGNPVRFKDSTGLQSEELLTKQLAKTPQQIPPTSGVDYGTAAAQGRQAFRQANAMLPGTQAQHWTKEITSQQTQMSQNLMNENMSPLQSRNSMQATTLLKDPAGGGTTYRVDGGSTYGNEHKFADRHLIPAEEARTVPGTNPRNAAIDAGRAARWRMTGDPGPGPPVKSLEARLTGGTLKVLGGALAVAGAGLAGWQVGSGIEQIIEGRTALGAIDVVQGIASLAMNVGAPAAVKAGAIVTGGSAAAAAVVGLAAGVSVGIAAETARAAVEGRATPLDVADKFYGTHFGDIYGWVTGSYKGR